MTAFELIQVLQTIPEDCEVLISNQFIKWSSAINDFNPLTPVEYDEDGTPICYLIAD